MQKIAILDISWISVDYLYRIGGQRMSIVPPFQLKNTQKLNKVKGIRTHSNTLITSANTASSALSDYLIF